MSFLFFSMIMTVKLTFNKFGSYLDELKSYVQKYSLITEVAPVEISLTTKCVEFGEKKFFKHEKTRLTHIHHTFRLKLLNLISRFGIRNSLFINHEINQNLWVLLLEVTKNNFVLYSFQLHLFFNLFTSRQCKDEVFFRKMKYLCSKNVENIISVFAKEYVFDILEIEEITHKMDKNHIDDNDVLKALFAKFDRNIQKTKQSKLELFSEDLFRDYNQIIFNQNVSKGLVSSPILRFRFLLMTFESIFVSENYKFLNYFMPEINIFQKALTTNDLPLISLNCIHFVLTLCLVRFEYTMVLLFGKVENLFRKRFIPLYKTRILHNLKYNLRNEIYTFLTSDYFSIFKKEELLGFKFLNFISYLRMLDVFPKYFNEEECIQDILNVDKHEKLMETLSCLS